MRIESTVTAISWIPSESVTGAILKLPFEVGVAHYDTPPPDHVEHVEDLLAADGARFANVLRGWIDVEDGRITGFGQAGGGHIGSTTLRMRGAGMTFAAISLPDLQRHELVNDHSVRFEQTAGGRTGVPAPRRVSRPPYVQISSPVAWSTLRLTLSVDGRSEVELVGASPFPRHWVYDPDGHLVSKSAVVDFRTWSNTAFGKRTPWGDVDSPALVSAVESALERELSRHIMRAGRKPAIRRLDPGQVLTEQGQAADGLFLLLDGVLAVDVDGERVAEVGPGALLGERAILESGRRTASLTAVTRCTVAAADADAVDPEALRQVAQAHRREDRL
jgi:hypothetical protein